MNKLNEHLFKFFTSANATSSIYNMACSLGRGGLLNFAEVSKRLVDRRRCDDEKPQTASSMSVYYVEIRFYLAVFHDRCGDCGNVEVTYLFIRGGLCSYE
ncbi:hypothetical protein JTB14_023684 [Gonioctena quinquepunctata]|nr:hypothetical protein JTB14_023684 [Gonioctena quinquepunctata]